MGFAGAGLCRFRRRESGPHLHSVRTMLPGPPSWPCMEPNNYKTAVGKTTLSKQLCKHGSGQHLRHEYLNTFSDFSRILRSCACHIVCIPCPCCAWRLLVLLFGTLLVWDLLVVMFWCVRRSSPCLFDSWLFDLTILQLRWRRVSA